MLQLPVLYTYRRCPYAMRARMALCISQQVFVAHEIVLRDKPRALLAASPKGTVPVLVLPDGQVLDESLDIMRWAFSQHDASGWGASLQTPQAQHWLALNDGAFKASLDRYKYPQRFGLPSGQSARDEAVQAMLMPLNHLLEQQPFMAGLAMGGLDLAVFPFVRQFAAVDAAWFAGLPCVAVAHWLAQCLSSEVFEVAMRKLPANTPQIFPASALDLDP
jgi:glutathione S-transferase